MSLMYEEREPEIRKAELKTTQNHENQMFQYLQAQKNQIFLLLANRANSDEKKNS